MIKLMYCVRRLPELSREEFQRYWRETHGPLVRERAQALGIRRYVQTHTLDSPLNEAMRASRGSDPNIFDGVAELWWDSAEAFGAGASTPEGRQAARELYEDEKRFIDLSRSTAFVAPLLTGLPPLIDDRSRVLILGSFPSEMSLAKHEYYGNPQNHFWPVMEALFGIDRTAPYGVRTERLLAQGVAVWDVIAKCAREGSGDDRIEHEVANPLVILLAEHQRIRHVAFNGGAAFASARLMTPEIISMPDVRYDRLPSTSPRNARMRLAEKVEAWRQITDWLPPL